MNLIDQQILNQNVSNKVKKLTDATNNVNHYLEESRSIFKEAFFQIAIVAAGTLSLSVSYVGYIISLNGGKIYFKELLYSGWFFLVLAVIGGLYRNYVYAMYGHWQMQIYRIEASMELDKATLELAIKLPSQIANIAPGQEMNEYIKQLKKNIKLYQAGIVFNSNKEKVDKFFWLLSEKMALGGFSIGLILVVVFASINLPK